MRVIRAWGNDADGMRPSTEPRTGRRRWAAALVVAAALAMVPGLASPAPDGALASAVDTGVTNAVDDGQWHEEDPPPTD